ncbi:hypothetical protein Scep_012019 [Stephania cephalantha]|uniref:Uncharacterized protein n=1 Tax=Stephania cephalantha TaxID=152367 RepID=A0AAP0P9H3_9MAGN
MADALSVIPTYCAKESIDKFIREAEECGAGKIVKQLAIAGDHDKITAMINMLTNEFTSSPQANHRKLEQLRFGKVHIPRVSQVRGVSKLDAYSLSVIDGKRKFERIMKGIQGALIVASTLHIVIGFNGLWRNVIR